MPLPKPTTPIYELELPSTGESIKYRPFLVKEEKVLLIALESEDTKQITTAIKTVIKSCILTKNIKVESDKGVIVITGIDKELVGAVAANIRAIRSPEPYKGKGIRFMGEEVRRKAGKAAAEK